MSRFKTELCNNLIELGICKYGDRCHYAHGQHELRQVSRRHPKYRTETCKNFELTGKCPFGPRCSYVHPKPDLDQLIDQLSRYMKHKKAPKPESDDEYDFKIFDSNDENKENQLFEPVFRRASIAKNLSTPIIYDQNDFGYESNESKNFLSFNNFINVNQTPIRANKGSIPLLNSTNESNGKKLRLINANSSSISTTNASASASSLSNVPSSNFINSSVANSLFSNKKIFSENQANIQESSSFNLRNSNYENRNITKTQTNSNIASDFKTLKSVFSSTAVDSVASLSGTENFYPNKNLLTRF